MRKDASRQFDWSPSMETLEDRVMMSADPVGGFLGGAIEQHTIVEELPAMEQHAVVEDPPALDHHLESMPDFWIDSDDQIALEEELRSVDQTLANAHDQTGLSTVRANYGFTGTGQTVAVIDSGIAYDHFALGGGFGSNYRVVGGWDFTGENDANPYDDGPAGSHGTHVAGIVGGDAGNDTGVAPDVDLVALRVFDDSGAGYFSWVENALSWVHANRNSFENPITAVNLSLGTNWNSDTIPSWAMLEDEFAQLEADGIFIAVSAGNSFTSYNTPGLSYPAASSYVIPVMSTDDDGLLSYFSQRESRAIAAPGRSIRSTVPDYAGNNNGIADDYAYFSGTSMAAPYVAGASVIVREAMEFVGYTNITQDTIYDHMIATADTIFDSSTGQSYSRLNMEAAIDALMPTDDYGSTVSTAYSLGTISDPMTMSGMIGTLSDVDQFSFTASSTGTVTFTASAMTNSMASAWEVNGGNGWTTGDNNEIYTVDVTAGGQYTVGISSSIGLGGYDLGITSESTFTYTDWGSVAFAQLADLSVTSDTWYRVAASSAGYLTIDASFDGNGGQINLELYDSSLTQIDSGSAVNGTSRVDAYATAGEEFYVRVLGSNADVDFRLTNLVSLAGTKVQVAGTAGDDTFAFTAGNTHVVGVNGVVYNFASIAITEVNFNGGAGNDTIAITGTAGDETATLKVGDTTLVGSGYAVKALNIENVSAFGGGGYDRAYLFDSAGNDVFVADPQSALLTGTGFSSLANDFDLTYSYARAGGTDRAYLFDSAGNDSFVARPEYARISGAGFYNYTQGFDEVNAYATAGGNDVSYLYDSAGNDIFTSRPEYGRLSGVGFNNYANGFDRVYASSTAGGTDLAYLYDSAGDDIFTSRPEYGRMSGSGFYNYSSGFDQVFAYATAGGNDIAYMYDSAGNDVFVARPEYGRMSGVGFYNYARGFDRVNAYAMGGGNDVSYLYDSSGNDIFTSRPEYGRLSGVGFNNYANGFDGVYAFSTAGGTDLAYLYDSAGDDIFTSRPEYGRMSGSGFYNYSSGFDQVFAYATAGGNDIAYMYDSAGNDVFVARPEYGRMSGVGFYNYARGFDRVNAYAMGGGNDVSYFYDSSGDDNYVARSEYGRMSGVGFSNYARGFDQVYAYATAGGNDQATIYATESGTNYVGGPTAILMSGNGFYNYVSRFELYEALTHDGNPMVDPNAVDSVFDDYEA